MFTEMAAFYSIKYNNLTIRFLSPFSFVVANAKEVEFSSLLESVDKYKGGYVDGKHHCKTRKYYPDTIIGFKSNCHVRASRGSTEHSFEGESQLRLFW